MGGLLVGDAQGLWGTHFFCSDLFMFRFVQILISKQRMYQLTDIALWSVFDLEQLTGIVLRLACEL